MRRKTFFLVFLVFSFFCAQAETQLQELFFEAAKYSLTGISENPEPVEISKIGGKYLKAFYSAKVARFDKNHRFFSLYIAEDLARSHIGEIDCLYWSAGFKTFSAENLENPKELNQAVAGQNLLDYLEQNSGQGIAEQNNKKEFSYLDKSGALRRFFYDGEGMSVNSYDGNIYITRTYGNEILRKCFDSSYRLISEEKLIFDSGLKSMSLDDLKSYDYENGSEIPSEMKEIHFPENKKSSGKNKADGEIEIETKFNASGLVSKVKTGHWEEISGQKKSEDKNQKKNPENDGKSELEAELKFFDDKLETYLYDEQNRVLEYELETWSYKKNLLGKLVTESLKTKYEYSYHDDLAADENSDKVQIPPDYKFYENGELRIERKYTAPGDYTEKMIFPGGLYVETTYEDGVKKLETIYNNGKESRRREF